ncbi:MAG: hypothetical protein D5R96_08850 [Methanocalculus sp. MSAO_Arc2]|uniref:hypothetical protein n=1 Tax=Methanocalculus sp. MSAO_Arc2 TaxID=2293855 RepID=UPI000FF19D75|nr:MAG: hypothetical protein D5R96_08850 [Methanocalculus sp. MSAO_Arc2]
MEGTVQGNPQAALRNTPANPAVDRMLRDVYENLDPLYRRIADALILHGMLEIVDNDTLDASCDP